MLLDRQIVPDEQWDLFGPRTDTPYTAAERGYSTAVQCSLEALLAGTTQRLTLLRRYYGEPVRVMVMRAPAGVDRSDLRVTMVERIVISTISFIRDVSPGGPVFQRQVKDRIIETQQFSTKYPHIVIERIDSFTARDRVPIFTEWRLRRTQNQKAETRINRWLDAANLGLSVIRSLAGQ